MNSIRHSAFLGAALMAAGILFLLSNLGVMDFGAPLVGALFCLGGLYFLNMLREYPANWWAVIPGVILIDLGALIVLSSVFPGQMSRVGGAFFLSGVSLAFWLVYFRTRAYWWAIIPAGVLLTLAAITVVDLARFSGLVVPATFFLGIAGTFALVYLLTGREKRFKWTWYPAGICGLIGAFFLFFSGGIIIPAAMIIVGLFLVAKTFLKNGAGKEGI
jgi:hypothetical protein